MRWKTRLYKQGDTRTITFFALLPVDIKIDGMIESRWLETVTVIQEYYGDGYWMDLKFVN